MVFDDLAGSHGTVSIAAAVHPTAVTFSNTATSYVLQGAGGIYGATAVAVNGPGSVTINNSNAYLGGTSVTNGMLNASASNALGTGTVSVSGGVVNDGAANSLGGGALTINGGTANVTQAQSVASVTLNTGLLNVAGSNATLGSGLLTIASGTLANTASSAATLAGNNPQNWTGNVVFVGSGALNMGTGAVTMSVSPTVYINSSTLTVGGAIAGGGNLTKSGSGTLVSHRAQLLHGRDHGKRRHPAVGFVNAEPELHL